MIFETVYKTLLMNKIWRLKNMRMLLMRQLINGIILLHINNHFIIKYQVNKLIKFILLLLVFTSSLLHADSFAQSKTILKEIYKDHQTTFYCGCNYSYENKENMIDKSSCGYEPRIAITKKGNPNERARRIEWEHVMPAENFGKHLPCWREGGRKACQKDPVFQKMEADMMNLVPAIGELNGDRSNYRYGANEPKIGQYGQCNFEVDFEANRAYVKPEIRGDIA
ncbi:MAG: hypothetical protein EOM29_10045, partial [Bacteroidia bacterium]|nr:hypothetical protein [Bacteroidia bacterium]